MDTSTSSHRNYMNGISYFPDNPISRLMMVGCSFFLGEKGYYNPANNVTRDNGINYDILKPYLLFAHHGNKSKQQIFYEVVNAALDFDFKETLEGAYKMRHVFMMRKSPMVVLAIAAAHPKRQEFNESHPGVFRKYIVETCHLPGDMISLLDAWKNLKGSKKGFPSFVKRAISDRLSSVSPYQANKYRKACIDCARLSHPKSSPILDELMKTGKLKMEEKSLKWETLRSTGKSWLETLEALDWKMPHMAALRNLRGFAIEVRDSESMEKYCQMLLNGVRQGKQFPFRYYTAYQQIKNNGSASGNRGMMNAHRRRRVRGRTEVAVEQKSSRNYHPKKIRQQDKDIIMDTLEECMQISIRNHPKLEGDVIVLSDNSGSAHGCVTSTYGSNTVAEIGNLSALMTAMSCTGTATIGLFGDTLLLYEVCKNRKFLEQFDEIQELAGERGYNVGGGSENGIWLFFKWAMKEPEKYRYDHFFCYSDMQAGHGGLYGNDPDMDDKWLWNSQNVYSTKHIHVPKLLENYRQTINPELSAFMVQTAGYDDTILPQSTYRGAILTGWTGNEVMYASHILEIWDKNRDNKMNKKKRKSTVVPKKTRTTSSRVGARPVSLPKPKKHTERKVEASEDLDCLHDFKVETFKNLKTKSRMMKKRKLDTGVKNYQRERNRKVKEREKKKNKNKYA